MKTEIEGYVEIYHSNCLTEPSYQISEDDILVNQVINTIGPDEFTVIVRGPELARLSQEYLGNCRYRFPFSMHLGGLYTLSIVFVHEEFDAIQETQDVRPLAFNLALTQNASWYHPGRDFSLGDWAQNAPCSKVAAHDGIWLHVDKSPISKLYSTNLSDFLDSEYNVQCDEKYFYHRSCSLGPVESLINYRPTCKPKKNLRILISGDSQSRHTYVALVNRFSGKSPRPFEKFDSEISYLPRLNMTIVYQNDIFLYTLLNQTIDQINQYDAILCNTAQWPASSAESSGHWTFAQYRNRVDKVGDQIRDWNHEIVYSQKSTKIIWQSLNPFPPWWLYTHPGHKDWRTFTRLQMWNNYAKRTMTSADIPVTGNFELLSPMTCRSYDGNVHFLDRDYSTR